MNFSQEMNPLQRAVAVVGDRFSLGVTVPGTAGVCAVAWECFAAAQECFAGACLAADAINSWSVPHEYPVYVMLGALRLCSAV